ncbi:MAG: O-acetylhomoserine aminocarboxypropyltransferase/cysteine synthase [Bacillota bacterium]|nr:O-acetylhomoserine aminocarboxypropyltransferase/cysteine synthase [Bacillota bacterium]
MKIETKCVQGAYKPKNGEPRVLPIVQSTTYKYDSSEEVGKLFDLEKDGFFYTRLANPTVAIVEEKLAMLEGGVGAALVSSGQTASMLSLLNIMGSGDHFVSMSAIYGGTLNLFAVTLKKFGIEVSFVNPGDDEETIQKAFKPNTKAFFGETIANPSLAVMDIEKIAKIAHRNGVPLIIDNTFATPYLCRPLEHGADIVVHSTTKYLDGHAVQLGGAIVDGGTFDWTNGKFNEFTEPDESYHGIIYSNTFGRSAYITKLRVQLIRDTGAIQTPNGAFLLNLGMETLALRMDRHSSNALKVAEYLKTKPEVSEVRYPKLDGDTYKDLADKYLPLGASGVVSFTMKDGREKAMKFMDSLKLAAIVVHVADVRTGVLHPASTTHRQLSDEQLIAAGINPGFIRFSVGIENVDDIIADMEQAFKAAK